LLSSLSFSLPIKADPIRAIPPGFYILGRSTILLSFSGYQHRIILLDFAAEGDWGRITLLARLEGEYSYQNLWVDGKYFVAINHFS